MKEIRISFELRIALKQTDVHWVEEELLRLREAVFLDVLRKVKGYRYLPQLRVAIQREIERQTVKKDQMKEAA